jgi:hypothetical protein
MEYISLVQIRQVISDFSGVNKFLSHLPLISNAAKSGS